MSGGDLNGEGRAKTKHTGISASTRTGARTSTIPPIINTKPTAVGTPRTIPTIINTKSTAVGTPRTIPTMITSKSTAVRQLHIYCFGRGPITARSGLEFDTGRPTLPYQSWCRSLTINRSVRKWVCKTVRTHLRSLAPSRTAVPFWGQLLLQFHGVCLQNGAAVEKELHTAFP